MNAEQAAQGGAELVWFKSSYSGGNGGECVEVAVDSTAVHVRDSKHVQGPHLSFPAAEWAAFVDFATEI